MKSFFRFTLFLSISITTLMCTLCKAQIEKRHDLGELIAKIRSDRSTINSFQAFGVREQHGFYYEPRSEEGIRKNDRTDFNPMKFVYVAFNRDQVRVSEHPYSEEDTHKTDYKKPKYFSSLDTKSVYYEKSGFHNVRPLKGGRYVMESAKTTLADPPQNLGFWVPEELKWPDELLETGRYKLESEKSDLTYGRVLQFVGNKDSQTVVRFTLAPNFNYRVVESTVTDSESTNNSKLSKMKQVKGVWCPMVVLRQISIKAHPEPSTEQWTFNTISLNEANEEDVRFKAIVGDNNHDIDKNLHSYTLGEGERKYVTPTNEIQSPLDMLKGWLFTGSIATLLVLTVGAYVKWKRNQLSKSA